MVLSRLTASQHKSRDWATPERKIAEAALPLVFSEAFDGRTRSDRDGYALTQVEGDSIPRTEE